MIDFSLSLLSLNLAILQTSNDNRDQGVNLHDVGLSGEEKAIIYFDWKLANQSILYEGTRLAFEPMWSSLRDKKRRTDTDQTRINEVLLIM